VGQVVRFVLLLVMAALTWWWIGGTAAAVLLIAALAAGALVAVAVSRRGGLEITPWGIQSPTESYRDPVRIAVRGGKR
jgi:hypothetical protein